MSSIPDFVRLKNIPVDYIQQVETDLLEAVVNQEATDTTTGFCRFELQNKGILHSHSKLFLSLVPNATQAYFPLNVGVGALVERAVLKIGNQVLNEITDWQNLFAVKSSLIDNEMNKEREQYTTGRMINHKYVDRNENNELTTVNFDKYGIDNGREAKTDGVNIGKNLIPLKFALMEDASPATIAESPVYALDLSDLFPFLKSHELPLFMINAPVSIELHWSKKLDDRVVVGRNASAGQAFTIDNNELKFCADYIFYGATDEMARYAEENKNMEFQFQDYRLAKTSATQAQLKEGIVSNLGMANRFVSRVIHTFAMDGEGDNSMLNRYGCETPVQNASSITGAISYNLRYNDRFEFSSDLTNPARIFNNFIASEGVPFVSRTEYSNEQGGLTAYETYGGRDQNNEQSGLRGKFGFIGTRLTGGRVGVKGIELHLKMDEVQAFTHTIRSYCEYIRVARLSNGLIEVYNV
jgi:hypothetical protein